MGILIKSVTCDHILNHHELMLKHMILHQNLYNKSGNCC